MINDKYIIYTDGGARGNPGPAAAAFVVFDPNGQQIHHAGFYLGNTTNNVAEYTGVIKALEWLISNTPPNSQVQVAFYLDSLLVVNQLTGKFKIKNTVLINLNQTILSTMKQSNNISITYTHIPREKNSQADSLVNQILDTHS